MKQTDMGIPIEENDELLAQDEAHIQVQEHNKESLLR